MMSISTALTTGCIAPSIGCGIRSKPWGAVVLVVGGGPGGSRRTAWRLGRLGRVWRQLPHRPHVGFGRPPADRALFHRAAAAPRLRPDQGHRGKDRRHLCAEPGRRLSGADLPRGGGLRDLGRRGQQAALHHHRGGQDPSQRQPRGGGGHVGPSRPHRRAGAKVRMHWEEAERNFREPLRRGPTTTWRTWSPR